MFKMIIDSSGKSVLAKSIGAQLWSLCHSCTSLLQSCTLLSVRFQATECGSAKNENNLGMI